MIDSDPKVHAKLSVIIVSYNVKYYLEQCLISLKQSLHEIKSEIFVVDNASIDGSVDYISSRFPEVFIIESGANLGFARANNLAIKQSTGDYVLLLNPDVIVAEDTIGNVICFMDGQNNIGGVGLRMMTITGTDAKESRRGIPTPQTALYKMVGLCSKYPQNNRFARYYMGGLPWNRPSKIDIVSGAFFAVPRKALNIVGLLDEDYFMYGEDIDLSYRLLKGGFDNWYLPERILHYKGESTMKSSYRYVHVFYNAMLIFFRKHFSSMSILLSIPIQTAIYFKAAMALIQMKTKYLKQSLGFLNKKPTNTLQYVFIGSVKSMGECQEIMKRKGLKAQYIEKTSANLLNGHNDLSISQQGKTCVIYDTKSFSYKDIFQFFAQNPNQNISIGTYNPETKVIITYKEILK